MSSASCPDHDTPTEARDLRTRAVPTEGAARSPSAPEARLHALLTRAVGSARAGATVCIVAVSHAHAVELEGQILALAGTWPERLHVRLYAGVPAHPGRRGTLLVGGAPLAGPIVTLVPDRTLDEALSAVDSQAARLREQRANLLAFVAPGALGLAEQEHGLCLTPERLERLRREGPSDLTPEQHAHAVGVRAWLDKHAAPRGEGGGP